MTELLKKEVRFNWDDKCERSFQTLRKLLTSALSWLSRILLGPLMYIVMHQVLVPTVSSPMFNLASYYSALDMY